MNAPARCRECFWEGCKGDCACRCHREALRCLYCRTGNHGLHNQSLFLGQTQPDVLACVCDPMFHRTKEEAL